MIIRSDIFMLAAVSIFIQLIILTMPKLVRANDLDQNSKALKIIGDYAARTCKDVPLKGTNTTFELSADAKVGLTKLIAKVAQLGIKTAGKYKNTEYEGILQSDIVTTIKYTNDCKFQITKYLGDKLLIKNNKTVSKRKEQKAKSEVLTQPTPTPTLIPSDGSINQNMNNSPGSLQIGKNDGSIIINQVPIARQLTIQQKRIFVDYLMNHQKGDIDIKVASPDREPNDFADEIIALLIEAGWKVKNHETSLILLNKTQGMLFQAHSKETAPSYMNELYRAFKSIGYVIDAKIDSSIPIGSLVLFIGYKP